MFPTNLKQPRIQEHDQSPVEDEALSHLWRQYQRLKYPIPDNLILPEPLRSKPVGDFAWYWRHRGKSWPRDIKALTLMATSGWSSRLALSQWLVDHDPKINSITSGSIKRLWKRLTDGYDHIYTLVDQRNVIIDRAHNFQVSMVWFTEMGREFLAEVGVRDRLRLLHNGPKQPTHTAMVILAAHLFRQRGYYTVVCPDDTYGRLRPDLMLVNPRYRASPLRRGGGSTAHRQGQACAAQAQVGACA